MNFSKGLTFANKEAVKRALIINAAKDNRNFTIRRSTKTKLCTTCIDESCKWYVGAFMKPKLNGLWVVTSYVGPHSCIPLGLRRDSRMMDLHQKLFQNCDKITMLILISSGTTLKQSMIMIFLTIRYGVQKKGNYEDI